jgi:4-aminobutyrate aminotransferase-like enzyme
VLRLSPPLVIEPERAADFLEALVDAGAAKAKA